MTDFRDYYPYIMTDFRDRSDVSDFELLLCYIVICLSFVLKVKCLKNHEVRMLQIKVLRPSESFRAYIYQRYRLFRI